jgi:hypothetical protein
VNSVEVGDTGATVDGVYRSIEYDGPRFYSVPDGEFLRHPNARDIKTSPFVAHKTRVTSDYLRRKEQEGIFQGVSLGPGYHGLDGVAVPVGGDSHREAKPSRNGLDHISHAFVSVWRFGSVCRFFGKH